jgi:signal transduction histidine kinase
MVDIQASMKKLLELNHYETQTASNGQEALDIIENGFMPNIIITDIHMPIMDGLTFIKKIKEEKKLDIPVIITTSHSDNEYLFEAIKLRVRSFVLKPIQVDEFLEAIKNIEKQISQDKIVLELERERLKSQQNIVEHLKQIEISDMIDNIIHQWREPLNTVSLLSTKIDWKLNAKEHIPHAELSKDIKTIMETVDYMSETTNDFKEFLDLEQSIETKFVLSEAFLRLKTLLEPRIDSLGVKVDLNINSELIIKGNINHFLQIFLNVFNNAFDNFEEKSTKNPTISIDIEVLPTLKISICDNGGGVPKEYVNKIFEHRFTTKKKKGTGIGLSICKNILKERFLGDIVLENSKDGACFIITIGSLV